jgi:hypothetical protein
MADQNIRILPGLGKRSPDAMLECAKGIDAVTIIGWDGEHFFFSSSHADCKDVLWDLRQAERLVVGEE